MTYYEAAIEILKTANEPLTVEEITDQAIKRGLIVPHGKTPVDTMNSELYTRLRDDPELVKLEERGNKRARRGSVRWTVRLG